MTVDWRVMFSKYIEVVGEAEGVHFLERADWEPDEWAAILELYDTEKVPAGWSPFKEWNR